MERVASEEQIAYICKLMYDNFKMTATYVNTSKEIAAQAGDMMPANPFFSHAGDWLEQLKLEEALFQFPFIRSINELENYVIVQVQRDSAYAGSVIVGPSLYTEITAEAAQGIINDFRTKASNAEMIQPYLAAIPIMKRMSLLHASVLLYYLIYGRELNGIDVFQQASMNKHSNSTVIGRNVDQQLSAKRENIELHHDLAAEKQLFQSIKEGRTELLQDFSNTTIEKFGVLSKSSHLRSQKNLAIAGITLATRAAMEGGLHPEVAYTMSDLYIQQMEELTDIQSVVKVRNEAMYAFAERVRLNREGSYSKAVVICQTYIFNHIYEEIPVELLAEKVQLTPIYLSQLFRKEVGIPLHAYIVREKVEEAKKLLSSSSLTLTEICARLNFYDQSHFTKIFKKLTGVTPKKFRSYETR